MSAVSRIASLLKSAIGPVVMLTVTLLVSEVLLRIVPSPVQSPSVHETDDPKSLLGIELVPNARETQTTSCSSWTVSVNSLGWRDKERTIERVPGKVRVAVLGDSFMEGAAVEDSEVFSRQLEDLLGSDVEVLNFGLSSLGTVQEEILYDKVVRQYDPDIVILSVYMNDVSNNDPVLEGGPDKVTRLAYRDNSGSIVKYQAQTSAFFSFRKFLRLHSAVFRLMKATDRIIRAAVHKPADTSTPASFPAQYLVFGPPQDENWERGWAATESSLLRLKADMKPEQKFFFFTAPSVIEIADDPAAIMKKEFKTDLPGTFDVHYFHDRLSRFAEKNGIDTLDLQFSFEQYIKGHNVTYPYFSRDCDGHWAAPGHRVAAEILAEQLRPYVDSFKR